MAITKITVEELMRDHRNSPVVDVRSPAEYHHAHIPGAFSIPLFSDDERRIIGTAYKQESREKAIRIGMEAFGKKMVAMVDAAENVILKTKAASRALVLHCWRGGMRSAAVAWLYDLYGFKVYLVSGGYKAYRHHVLEVLEKPYKLTIVGGYTGSNKTGVLEELKKAGKKIIDLEELALHKGSAFGNLEQAQQPAQEHFENLLAHALETADNNSEPFWVEGESQRLGYVNIPLSFFKTMRGSDMLFLDIPFEQRLGHILKGYGGYDKERLVNATMRIKKKLGGLETKNAVNALIEDDYATCFAILLKYYDKLYLKSTFGKEETDRKIVYVVSDTVDAKENMKKLLAHATH
jgi:tRNA 2-selenouridine synthase